MRTVASRSRRVFVVAAAAVLGSLGCSEELPPGSLIERPRVLGGRVDIAADPGRAAPRPGETASLTWLIVGPDDLRTETWPLVVPGADVLGGADAVPVAGVVADTTVELTVPLAPREGSANRHPTLADDVITFDGRPWNEAACLEVPAEPPRAEHAVDVAADAADAEEGDTLQLSTFTTAGRLQRQFSPITPGEAGAPAPVELAWKTPAKDEPAPPDGAVRFVFVLRDLRGGIDWTTRTLCVQ